MRPRAEGKKAAFSLLADRGSHFYRRLSIRIGRDKCIIMAEPDPNFDQPACAAIWRTLRPPS